jgi:hypothetical protein
MRKIIPKEKYKILKKLNTPTKVQDFLNKMEMNFEENGDTVLSPMTVLEKGTCHCIEAAVLAALALRVHGHPPLVIDLTANDNDYDHVVAVFKKDGKWGAISKTNHAVLRYREPVYNTIRELALSYFHEYTNNKDGKKTLRSYTRAVNLKRFDRLGWMTTKEEIDYIPEYLADIKHVPILTRKQIRNLRKLDEIEITAGKITEWKQL